MPVNGLRYFYGQVLHRPAQELEFSLPRSRQPIRRPRAFSVEEVQRLLEEGFTSPKYRAFFMTLYGGGLRLSEGCHLKVGDIDSKRMLIRVERGKGKKDRSTILSLRLLSELRAYWRVYRPFDWLFPNRSDPQAR